MLRSSRPWYGALLILPVHKTRWPVTQARTIASTTPRPATNGNGADVIFDPVGGDLFDQAVRAIAWNGRLLVIGFASGRIPEFPVNLALLKGAAVVGVFWGAFAQRQPEDNAANFAQLFTWFDEGRIKPLVSKVYPLERAAEAIDSLGTRKAVGKVVVTTGIAE